MAFVVHRSNRAEELVRVLAELVRRPAGDPFQAEWIVVQGRGMERWLSMELAKRLGVWANPEFPFPRRLIDRALDAVLGEEPAALFEPETLMWSIAELLEAEAGAASFAAIRTYLDGDRRGRKRVQLAERIADTFDHYAVYRPEMVLGWESGEGEGWQPILWRALVRRHGAHHVAARAARFRAARAAGRIPGADFPRRVCLFGISALPPLYVDLLQGLARFVELHLFVLSPSAEYWADAGSRREQLRLGGAGADLDALHVEESNPLLASLGRLGRDFQRVLEERVDYEEPPEDLYRDPGAGSMLAALQSDILHLRARRGAGALAIAPGDRSVAVHSCHGPMRELEVLHDQLLALFESEPDLEPHEVVVMTPSIEAYASYIDAVFAAHGEDAARIPHRLADRRPRAIDEVIDAFEAIVAALPGRLAAPELLDLLGFAAVRERFGIAAQELGRARRWVHECGIRWGVDESHRASVGQPQVRENTWRFGLDRLLLGYALPGEEQPFAAVAPYEDVEGASAALLGGLAEFCDTLFTFRRRLAEPRPLARWREDLGALAESMISADGERASQQRRIAAALESLQDRAAVAGFTAAVDLDTVRIQLARELERSTSARGFLSGGVTFCELVPMRSIPFRVVCLIGMNDDAFPRHRRPPGFDLITESPRAGDRSPRDDDRYLFLEALLSARERLIVTYAGQSIHDNAPRPPSVVVSELLDAIDDSFRPLGEAPGARRMRDDLVVDHPLQPFSPRYFDGADARLFSYGAGHGRGARSLRGARRPSPVFIARRLPPEGDAECAVDVDELVRFFDNPSRSFLQRRLALFLGGDAEALPEREPLFLAGLDRWRVGDRLLARLLRGEALDDALALLAAQGALPYGALGRCELASVSAVTRRLGDEARPYLRGERLPPQAVDRRIGGLRIVGALRDVWPAAQVVIGFSKLRAKHHLRVWIRHLLLAAGGAGRARPSVAIGRTPSGDDALVRRLRPADDADALLADLVELFEIGRTAPLPFFPEISFKYVESLRGGKDPEAALEAAAERYAGEENYSEADDPYVGQVYGSANPIEGARIAGVPDFAAVALRVWEPLLDHVEDEA